MKPSRLLSPAARTLLSPSAGGLGGWLAILARAQSADHQGPGHSSGSGLPTQICRHCRCLRIRFCKLFVTVNIPIEEYFSQISVAINIPRHQIKFLCAFLIDPLLWILNTFMIRFLNTSLCFNKWTRHSTLLTCYIFLKPVNDNHRLIRDPAPR